MEQATRACTAAHEFLVAAEAAAAAAKSDALRAANGALRQILSTISPDRISTNVSDHMRYPQELDEHDAAAGRLLNTLRVVENTGLLKHNPVLGQAWQVVSDAVSDRAKLQRALYQLEQLKSEADSLKATIQQVLFDDMLWC